MRLVPIKLNRDNQFIQRIRENDRSVLGDLFRRHQKAIHRYIQRAGGTEAEAEELLQEAIILLWQKVHHGRFYLSTRLHTFLLAVVKYKWNVERHQKRQRWKQQNSSETVEDLLSPEWHPGPQEVQIVQEALEKLAPLCKQLLLLYYFEGRSLRSIARAFHFNSPESVEKRINHCLDQLEEHLNHLLS